MNRLVVLASIALLALSPRSAIGGYELLPTGSMVHPRSMGTATTLLDGTVLVAGGFPVGTTSQTDTAETYDPASGTFTLTAGPMANRRWSHSAIRLDDGRVLIAGGWRSSYITATAAAEIYDPATRTFSPTGSMTIARGDRPTMVKLADGSVLVLGGTYEGGLGTATTAVDRWTPATGTFSRVGELLLSRRDNASCVLDDGSILLVGGACQCCGCNRTFSAEIWDPDTHTSYLTGALPLSRFSADGESLFDGRCAFPGGQVGVFTFEADESYVVREGVNIYGEAASATRGGDGRVVIAGLGAWLYDPFEERVIRLCAAFNDPGNMAARLDDGSVLIAGGNGDGMATRRAWRASPNPAHEDTDFDAVPDACDNCPDVANPGQGDADGDGRGDDCENLPPWAGAGSPLLVACRDALVTDAVAGDPDGDGLSYEWTTTHPDVVILPASGFLPGGSPAARSVPVTAVSLTGLPCGASAELQLTVTDVAGVSASSYTTVTFDDGDSPLLSSLPGDLTVECGSVPDAPALTASDACDPSPALSFTETSIPGGCGGEFTIVRTWLATDACGNALSHSQQVEVRDRTPPTVVESNAQIAALWPPNHRMVRFGADSVEPTIHDGCGGTVTWRFASCASNQPDDGRGDGATEADCQVAADGLSFEVRAERDGRRPQGRRYEIQIIASDECGNESLPTRIGVIEVPRDRRARR